MYIVLICMNNISITMTSQHTLHKLHPNSKLCFDCTFIAYKFGINITKLFIAQYIITIFITSISYMTICKNEIIQIHFKLQQTPIQLSN